MKRYPGPFIFNIKGFTTMLLLKHGSRRLGLMTQGVQGQTLVLDKSLTLTFLIQMMVSQSELANEWLTKLLRVCVVVIMPSKRLTLSARSIAAGCWVKVLPVDASSIVLILYSYYYLQCLYCRNWCWGSSRLHSQFTWSQLQSWQELWWELWRQFQLWGNYKLYIVWFYHIVRALL